MILRRKQKTKHWLPHSDTHTSLEIDLLNDFVSLCTVIALLYLIELLLHLIFVRQNEGLLFPSMLECEIENVIGIENK